MSYKNLKKRLIYLLPLLPMVFAGESVKGKLGKNSRAVFSVVSKDGVTLADPAAEVILKDASNREVQYKIEEIRNSLESIYGSDVHVEIVDLPRAAMATQYDIVE